MHSHCFFALICLFQSHGANLADGEPLSKLRNQPTAVDASNSNLSSTSACEEGLQRRCLKIDAGTCRCGNSDSPKGSVANEAAMAAFNAGWTYDILTEWK